MDDHKGRDRTPQNPPEETIRNSWKYRLERTRIHYRRMLLIFALIGVSMATLMFLLGLKLGWMVCGR